MSARRQALDPRPVVKRHLKFLAAEIAWYSRVQPLDKEPAMRPSSSRLTVALAMSVGLAGCVVTRPVVLPVEKYSVDGARQALPQPLLENLSAFGNNLARIMLDSYKLHSIAATADGNALLYRFDAAKPGTPPHAYLTIALFPKHPGGPGLATGVGDGSYKIGLGGVGIGLVAADAPAVVEGNTFKLKMAKGFVEAFNPWCSVNLASCYPMLNLFLKDPATKAAKQKELAGLLLSAMPEIKYLDHEPVAPNI